MGDFNRLEALFYHQIRDIYNDERQYLKALPKMAESLSNKERESTFPEQLEEADEFILKKTGLDVLDAVMGQYFPEQDLRLNQIIPERFEYNLPATRHQISTG